MAIAVAERTGFHDEPAGYKSHRSPTPYLGGAAVLVGFVTGGVLLGGAAERLLPLFAVVLALWATGTADDRFRLAASTRVLIEVAGGAALWVSGLGWDWFSSESANLALTLVWVVGVVNAFNLMDNMDGVATTVAAVSAAAVSAMALVQGDLAIAVLCAALCGACVGFLPYNAANPARIFLGDGGALPIGFVLAASTMALSHAEDAGWTLLLAAILVVSLPVVDTVLVVVSRSRRGAPVLAGARDHMTHRLATRLVTPARVAIALGAAQAVVAGVAVGAVELGDGLVVAAWATWFVAAVATVAVLDSGAWAAAPARGPPRATGAPEGPRPPSVLELAVVGALVLACGLSPLYYGFYDLEVWGPIALGLLAVLLGLVIARPCAPNRRALAALGGLALLWLWSLASTGWGESSGQALVEANRWLLYLALLATLVLLLRDDRLSALVMGCAVAAVLGLAAYLVVVLLAGDGASLFLNGRLHAPLGYANGEAGYLLLAFWPLVAMAERLRPWPLSGLAVGAATVVLGLVLLTQTRAVIPALVVTLVAMLALIPGRRARGWALLAIAAGLAPAVGPIVDVYRSDGGAPGAGALHGAVGALLAGALLAGAVWSAVSWLAQRPSGAARRRLGIASGSVLAVVAIAATAVAVAVAGDPVDKARGEYRAFVDLRSSPSSGTRLSSGAGNRYDYWRIAVRQFDRHPIRGVGAGNYDRTYYLERRTTEDITQPHSLPLQVAGELGAVGLIALVLFAAAVLAGLWTRASAARDSPFERTLAVAAGGMFLTWLVHTSVDWLHEIPGVTGIALCGAAVLIAPWRAPRAASAGHGRRVVAAVAALAVVLGAVEIGRSALAEHHRADAARALPEDPAGARAQARSALRLNGDVLPAYYVLAAAEARLGDYTKARAALLEATRREPHEFVTWGLLGDIAVRRGDRRAARTYYGRASRLNPRDAQLRRLARHPLSGG